MKNTMLFPRKFRLIGLVLFPFSLANLIARYFWNFKLPFFHKEIFIKTATGGSTDTLCYDYTEQVAWISAIVLLFMMAFSKQKNEDEYVQSVRLNSLLTSIYAYTVILLLVTLFSIGSLLLLALINIILLLVIFIIIFNYSLYIKPRLSKNLPS